MEAAKQRDIGIGLVNGKVGYKVIHDPNTSLKRAYLSDNALNSTIPCTVFTNDFDCYITQSHFNTIENSNTLTIICFDEANKCFLAQDLHCTIDEWLEKKLVEDIERGKRAACRHYCRDGSHMPWWRKIMKEFKDVFGSVTSGLAAIHRANAFHGNILKGVSIKIKQDNTPIGVLFNMTLDPKQGTPKNIEDLQYKDINDLKILMERALWYPFDVSKSDRPRRITQECYSLCLMQLEKRVSIGNTRAQSLKGTWGLQLAIFWDEIEQIAFMKRVYRLVYHELPKYSCYKKFAYYHFKNYDWATSVMTHGTDKLKAVLQFDGHKSFNRDFTKKEEDIVERNYPIKSDRHGLDKLIFRRCCIEHMDLDNGSIIENHLELMKILPELLFETVKVFHHTLHLNRYMPSIASLFKDMGWDKLKGGNQQKN
ncbi:uncharacterized protein LOC121767883 [Salvia splendens]|nr:uncharacterized protein LOC121767883 [Salvia splendens]